MEIDRPSEFEARIRDTDGNDYSFMNAACHALEDLQLVGRISLDCIGEQWDPRTRRYSGIFTYKVSANSNYDVQLFTTLLAEAINYSATLDVESTDDVSIKTIERIKEAAAQMKDGTFQPTPAKE